MTTGDSSQRAHRSSTRDAPRSKRSGLHSRSPSTSSRSSGAISRSRSRERPSQNRHSRSASRSRKSRHSSHRSRRSRSRSIGRDHKSRRENREYSSRHRERDRGRGRDSDRRSGSSRKRSRRDHSRSRSRSTNRRRRSHRDSSPHADENGRDRRQRRRRGSDPASTEKQVEAESVPTVATATSPVVPVPPQEETKSETVTQLISKTVIGDGQDQQDTPTSQESLATTTASIAASSQGDVEVLTSKAPPVSQNSITDDHKSTPAEPSNTSAKCVVPPVKVDVKSIKMDIMKALADARNTIAGIKNSASPAAAAAAADTSKGVGPKQAEQPTESENTIENVSVEEIALLPQASVVEQQPQPTQASAAKPISPPKQQVSAAEVDEFDMFSAAELHGAGLSLSPATAPAVIAVGAAVQSNYDDADGYYKPSIGEILNGSYRVLGTVGKGVFSTVLRCQRIASTTADPEIVAIKLIRNNDIMRDAAQTEIKILTHLSERDARDKKHCVRLLDRFEHRNHVALVFESMQMNVREAMKKFGGKGGISIQAVRIFCKHLLIALSHLDACSIVHADIKPDNILLDEKQTMIKMCDFGSAFESNGGKHDPTPYLVSRFYRAPEIVLGLPYDKAVDMWSVGCCLYEMFTGKVMFPGATNNEMLKLFMELKGKVPNKIIKKHRQAYIEQFQMEPHFTEDNKFCSHEIDRVTGKAVLRLMDAMKTRFDLGGALLSAKSSTDDRKQVLELRNLLERMFTLDAVKRISPKEALAHPFVKTEGKHAA